MHKLQKKNSCNIVSQFEIQVQNHPISIAVIEGRNKISYEDLNKQSNQITHYLKQQGVKPEDFVAILLEPKIDFIVVILAIIKLGAVYVPLDTISPKKRLNDIIKNTKPKVVITNNQFKSLLQNQKNIHTIKDVKSKIGDYPIENISHNIKADSPIYMMFTSGSTGLPKGVIIPHQAVFNLCVVENYANINSEKLVAQFSNLAFDACTFEIWSALLNAATLSIVPPKIRQNPDQLSVFFKKNHIDYLFLPTAFFHQITKSAPQTLDNIPNVIFGGEQVNLNLIKNFIEYRNQSKKPITLINGYGPTEATTFTCRNIMTEKTKNSDDELMSIGKPFINIKCYILDEHMNPSDEGELYISGINLAIGYHNSESHNQEKFISNPFSQDVLYRQLYKTGDKVRKLPGGNLLCLGRLDDQVKIGGFRIHLNEIEKELMLYPNISLAAVKDEIGGSAHKMLTAYIVLDDTNKSIHADDIRNFLAENLPTYMLPSKYVMVEELPLTLVGKVDKQKLNQIPHTDLSFHLDESSAHPIENKIKDIWCHLLNKASIDVHKNFFDLGFNSLLITEACAILNEELHSELKIIDILSHPTIYKLSRFLEGDIDQLSLIKHKKVTSTDIAVIGMSCRFPKANSIDEFWDNICHEKDCLERFDTTDEKNNDPSYVPVRGTISGIEYFDAAFFGLSPTDATITDPQHRIFLECAWEALEHAGVAPKKAKNKVISVFAGMTDSTYLQENLLKNNWYLNEHDHFHQRISTSTGMLSTQLSYRLNLKGRSINVNTACSTGLIAVDQACQDLVLGDSDVAISGAISIIVPQQKGYFFKEGGIVSPQGRCTPFSNKSSGTVFSNGVGVVILKRLQDAIDQNDTIYAVIKGRGVNNDGANKIGYTAPSHSGQLACILSALEQSKLSAKDISYVEAHGTATSLGDLIEFNALSEAYRSHTKNKNFCALGSVKANIGHTDVAAGMAGLIKTVLCLHHQKIPPMPYFENPNPELVIDKSAFFINQKPIIWNDKKTPYHAGISAFGVGGTNIHMVIGEYRKTISKSGKNKKINSTNQLILLSAKTEKALEESISVFISHMSNFTGKTENYLARAAYTLQTSREDFPYRKYAVGKDIEELLRSFAKTSIHHCNLDSIPNIVFMFPGQGMHYPKMAHELMSIPLFEKIVNKGAQIASSILSCDFLSLLHSADSKALNETKYAQPALFIIEYALAKLLMSYGIKPNALIGHSLGEYVAACLADVFSFEDGVSLICERGILMSNAPEGAMLAIDCSADVFNEINASIKGLELALHNSKKHWVVACDTFTVERLESYLEKNSIAHQKLNTKHAFHTSLMEPIKEPFIEMMTRYKFFAPSIPIVSNLSGDWLSAQQATDMNYWYKHLRNTVRFKMGLNCLLRDTNSIFIEVGPKQSLITFLRATAPPLIQKNHQMINTLSPYASDMAQINSVLGMCWMHSIQINWKNVHENENLQKINLPTYPFQKQRYWLEPDKLINPLSTRCYMPVWSSYRVKNQLEKISSEELNKYSWIIIKDKIGLGDQFLTFLKKHQVHPIVVEFDENFSFDKNNQFTINPKEKAHYLKLTQVIKKNINHPIILSLSSFNDTKKSGLERDIETQLDLSFYNLLYLSQALNEEFKDPDTIIKFGVITNGTQNILGTESINPANATLIGPCRVIMQEHPHFQFKLIDITKDEQHNQNLISKIMTSCIKDTWSSSSLINAYRNGYQWDVRYNEMDLSKNRINRLKDAGIYLITGGVGGISLSCCEAIAKEISSPTFILLSRKAIPKEQDWQHISTDSNHEYYELIQRLLILKNLNAKLFFYQVDISKRKPLVSIIEQCIKKFGTINGLIHAAGISSPDLMQNKTSSSIQKVFAPKIQGTYNLAFALKDISLDFVVLKSSLAALLGGFKQVDYSAANASLDAFASSDLFSKSSFVTSINWNTWRDVGIAARDKKEGKSNFIGKGDDISTEEGQKIFLNILQNESTHVAVSKLNINDTKYVLTPAISPALPKISREELSITEDYMEASNKIELRLVQLWQESLGIDNLGVNDDFFALGGHSLQAISLIDKINKQLNCTFPMTQIYDTPSIHELSEAISALLEINKSIVNPLKKTNKSKPAIFLCHPVSGLLNCYDELVKQYKLPMSLYGLKDPSVNAENFLYGSLVEMAIDYLSEIKKIQATGPYYLVGYSFGGNLLHEVVHLLQKEKEEIALLGMIDSWAINAPTLYDENHFKTHLKEVYQLPEIIINLAWQREKILLSHTLNSIDQDMLLFKASKLLDEYKNLNAPNNGWKTFNKGNISCHSIEADHISIMNSKNVAYILKTIEKFIRSEP